MRTFLKILLWLFIIILVSGVVFSGIYLLDRPIEEGFYILGAIIGIWLTFVIVRKLIIRMRAKAQVNSILNIGAADEVDDELGMSNRELNRSLKKSWNQTLRALKRSQLKFQGDPLYVLPWFMIFGRPTSGKSTSLRNSKLLQPSIDLSTHEDGSTLNMEWWLYEEGIIIDTAGRYAVPDRLERDRKEWTNLLSMLGRHRQKEPLNGLVLAVAANRLLNCSEEELLEEGRQVRNSINRLMEKLEVKVPVYLMVTKADLIPGFTEWSQYLPEEVKSQAMGYLNESSTSDMDSVIDSALDNVLDRLKEIRLLMMEQTDEPDESLLTLPRQMEDVRSGLHTFIKTALKGNAYQEAPMFRGLYFSSSLQEKSGETVRNGMFLHDFFTKILPADRSKLVSLPSALRIQNALRRYALGIVGAITLSSVVGLTALYDSDKSILDDINKSYSDTVINLTDEQSPSDTLDTAFRLKSLIDAVAVYEQNEMLPWGVLTGNQDYLSKLKNQYLTYVKNRILKPYDSNLKQSIDGLQEGQTSALAGGLVRRINTLQRRLRPELELEALPIGNDYLMVQNAAVRSTQSELFTDIYYAYVDWTSANIGLEEEKKILQASLLYLVKNNHGDYNWILQWANAQGFDTVRLKDFWGGSMKIMDPPSIDAAYTLEGYEFIQAFLTEFKLANKGDDKLAEIQEDFDKFYQRQYVDAWLTFAERFDEGKLQQRDQKEWQILLERMATADNPYFSLMDMMVEQLDPFSDADYNSKPQFALFSEIQSYSIADGRKGKPNAKVLKKVLGKFGKAGKAAKKAMNMHKKATKGMDKGGEVETNIDEAVAAVDLYKQALGEIALNADKRSQSLAAVKTLFTMPDTPEQGDGSVANAWSAIRDLQALVGRPTSTSKMFWQLFMGPMSSVYDYMQNESSCELQDRWQNGVLASIEGVNRNQIGNLLVGEGGILWNYLDTEIAPFVHKQFKRGFVRSNVEKRSLGITEDLLDVLNKAQDGKFVVGNTFNVAVNALPTGANPGAQVQPYATFLDLHCSDGTQVLANYNYPTQHDFKWALETCGDTTLRIEIGQLTLLRNYTGVKGFGKFLQEFQDGRHIFSANDFPNQEAQLLNKNVQYIDVNFEIRGQRPVVQMLDTVPLTLPEVAAHCW